MPQIRRRQLWVDARLQGALLFQAAVYWLYCLVSISVVATVWIIFAHGPATSADLFRELWHNCGPMLVGSLVLLPLILLDCLRISNRIAGPVVRLRREMKALAEGKVSRPVLLREGDFWLDFAEDWNRVLGQVTAASKRSGFSHGDEPTVPNTPPSEKETRPAL